jgi:hypothetical protein
MKEIAVNKPKVFTVPEGATKLIVTHEWGDVLVDAADVVDTYYFTPDSIGQHKFVWTDDDGVLIHKDFYDAFTPLLKASEFFADFPDLSDFDSQFPQVERLIRHTIQGYTNTKFGPYVDKTLEIQGDGGDSLYLPVRITALTSVTSNFGDDYTDQVEIAPNDDHCIQRQGRFRVPFFTDVKRDDIMFDTARMFDERFTFSIVGDFGFEVVPVNVSEAAKLLLNQGLGDNEIIEMRRQGANRIKLGDFFVFLTADQFGSTGNSTADMLLGQDGFWQIGLI